MALLTIFVLSAFLGFEVISKVSTTLHTPLMSGANAIHGVILVGAILVAGDADSTGELVVALVAVVLATLNMVGGFVVTDRMLEMFGRGGGGGRAASGRPNGPDRDGERAVHTGLRGRFRRLRSPSAAGPGGVTTGEPEGSR
jgi:NAD(P) transhydrogenase subunit alpha